MSCWPQLTLTLGALRARRHLVALEPPSDRSREGAHQVDGDRNPSCDGRHRWVAPAHGGCVIDHELPAAPGELVDTRSEPDREPTCIRGDVSDSAIRPTHGDGPGERHRPARCRPTHGDEPTGHHRRRRRRRRRCGRRRCRSRDRRPVVARPGATRASGQQHSGQHCPDTPDAGRRYRVAAGRGDNAQEPRRGRSRHRSSCERGVSGRRGHAPGDDSRGPNVAEHRSARAVGWRVTDGGTGRPAARRRSRRRAAPAAGPGFPPAWRSAASAR
jgi:hypothetical protein